MSVDIHALSGAYALNAVDDLERAAFDRHLAECDTCVQEVAGLLAAATSLADETWSVAPPGMRERVLHEVSRTGQARPEPARRSAGRRAAGAAGIAAGRLGPRRWRNWTLTAAAAAALVVASAAGTYLLQENRTGGQVTAGEQRLAQVERVLTANDATLRRGQALPGGGRLSVAVSRQEGSAVAILSDMRAPLSGKCYTFWQMRDGRPVRAGLFPAGQADGLQLIGDIGAAEAVAISEESCAAPPDQPTHPIAATPL
jgi:anti-sigma factor RsiW